MRPISRRPFLAGLAAGGAATLLRPLIAEAEGVTPRRFLYIHYPCGTNSGLTDMEGRNPPWYWFPPAGEGTSYTASPLLDLFGAVRGSILPMDGVDGDDPDQRIDGDKNAQGIMSMGTGFIPVPADNAPIEGDPPNA